MHGSSRHRSLILVLTLLAIPACGSESDGTPDIQDAVDEDASAQPDGDQPDEDQADGDQPDGGQPDSIWYEGLVFYEIFVRSFFDSDGNGIGDLAGVMAKLDYLNDGRPGEGDDLEVDGLWLMPIFRSPSYHGYDATNYLEVTSDYGSEEDLVDLVEACHERGMVVILDLMLNHTSSQHPWFVDSREGPQSGHRNWYVWRTDNPGWQQPFGSGPTWHGDGDYFYYGVFASSMPDLNYHEPQVVEAMTEVVSYWLNRGIDGYRLDAARFLFENADGEQADLPETHTFFQGLRDEVESLDPDAYLVGECWGDRTAIASYYGDGAELHQAFDFSLSQGIEQALLNSNPASLRQTLSLLARAGTPWSYAATFVSNHDFRRMANRYETEWRQRAAVVLLMTLPGTPYVYYGDELGLRQSSAQGDPGQRAPMPWDSTANGGFSTGQPWEALATGFEATNVAAAISDPDSLLALHRDLIRLRHDHAALGTADGVRVLTPGQAPLFAMLRFDGREVFLVAVNFGGTDLEPEPLDLSAHGDLLGEPSWHPEVVLGSGQTLGEVTRLDAFPLGSTMAPGEGRVVRLR